MELKIESHSDGYAIYRKKNHPLGRNDFDEKVDCEDKDK
jgi:hypothetical protein